MSKFIKTAISILLGVLMIGFFIFSGMVIYTSCCEPFYLGNEESGYTRFEYSVVTVEEAIELAEPYLDKTFELRTKDRLSTSEAENTPQIQASIKGKYYYIVKDKYLGKNAGFYIPHAVKVNKDTGEIILPE